MRNKIMSSGSTMFFENKGEDIIPGGAVVIFDQGGTPFVGVAVNDIPPGDTDLADTAGVFRLQKGSAAIAAHAPVFIDAANKNATPVSGVYAGRAWEAAEASAEEVLVRLNFGPAPTQAPAQAPA